jgi:hypothetical protein
VAPVRAAELIQIVKQKRIHYKKIQIKHKRESQCPNQVGKIKTNYKQS